MINDLSSKSTLLPLDVIPTAARFNSSTQTSYSSGEDEDEETAGRISSL